MLAPLSLYPVASGNCPFMCVVTVTANVRELFFTADLFCNKSMRTREYSYCHSVQQKTISY